MCSFFVIWFFMFQIFFIGCRLSNFVVLCGFLGDSVSIFLNCGYFFDVYCVDLVSVFVVLKLILIVSLVLLRICLCSCLLKFFRFIQWLIFWVFRKYLLIEYCLMWGDSFFSRVIIWLFRFVQSLQLLEKMYNFLGNCVFLSWNQGVFIFIFSSLVLVFWVIMQLLLLLRMMIGLLCKFGLKIFL